MAKWGINQDETFVVSSGNLTADFEDNVRIGNCPGVDQAFVYVDYTKGTEDYLLVRVQESLIDDDNPVTEQYFVEVVADADGHVFPFIFKIRATGKYRIPLMIGESEDRIRVAVAGEGSAPFDGVANLYYGLR